MDDLSGKLNSLLSDPKSMELISSLLGSLDNGGEHEHDDGEHEHKEHHKSDSSGGLFNPENMELLTKLAPLMSAFGGEDDNTKLLMALRPHLGDDRRQKLDNAKNIMKIMKLLPLIKETGIL